MLEPMEQEEGRAGGAIGASSSAGGNKQQPTTPTTPAESATSNKPPSSSFHQQRLAAWQPLITAGTVFPLFLVFAVLFFAIGVPLLLVNTNIVEFSVDYTGCSLIGRESVSCASLVEMPEFYGNYSSCQCRVNFTLAKSMPKQVYAYYALTGFHQNHRKYVKSHDGLQLSGRRSTDLEPECSPYRRGPDGAWIAPCGAVANSLFNDTFRLVMRHPSASGGAAESEVAVPWTSRGIAWLSDVSRKYGRVDAWNGTVKPPNWPVPEADRSPDGFSGDEELQVWLSVAALPTFRKLHRLLLHSASGPFADVLPAGNYTLLINYSYPVSAFGGTKSFVLSTAGILGGKNAGLGGLAVAVGCLHLALCCLFAVLHVHSKRCRKSDPFYGMDPQHRILLEGMVSAAMAAHPNSNEDDEEDGRPAPT